MVSPPTARLQLTLVVQGQAFNSSTAGTRQAFNMQAVYRPSKMARPPLSTWIEERHCNPRIGIDSGGKRQFFLLTGIAAQCEVSQRGGPTTRFRHDVIKAQAVRKKLLGSLTIFTAVTGAPGHARIKSSKIGFAWPGHSFPQSALGLRRAR